MISAKKNYNESVLIENRLVCYNFRSSISMSIHIWLPLYNMVSKSLLFSPKFFVSFSWKKHRYPMNNSNNANPKTSHWYLFINEFLCIAHSFIKLFFDFCRCGTYSFSSTNSFFSYRSLFSWSFFLCNGFFSCSSLFLYWCFFLFFCHQYYIDYKG